MLKYLLLLSFSLTGSYQSSTVLGIKNVSIPTEVNIGDDVTLVCEYDIGDNLLFSVRWYKGRYEFYRYTPNEDPRKKIFARKGITININNSSDSKLVLTNVNNSTSGKYSCEVTTDAPSFLSYLKKGELLVKDIQRLAVTVHVPNVTKVGDTVTLVCNYHVGNKPIYSVNWYKGPHEIYRYVEDNQPTKWVFPQPNIIVDERQSSQTEIVLKNVQPGAADNYTCKVLTGAPLFLDASDSGYLHIKQKERNKKPFIQVSVPNHVTAGDNAVLLCNYSIGSLTLHTVKWYKNSLEFYRYTPSDTVKIKIFPQPGIDIDVDNSTESRLVLKSVGSTTFGDYRCEMSSGPPQFLFMDDSRMLYVFPIPSPTVIVNNQFVSVGDKIQAVCTVPVLDPPVDITWLLNGNKVENTSVTKKRKQWTASFVNVEVVNNLFENNKANLTCVSSRGQNQAQDQTTIVIIGKNDVKT